MLNLSGFLHENPMRAEIVARRIVLRAALAWARIQDKSTLVVMRNAAGVKLAAQTVRIEFSSAGETASVAGVAPRMNLTIFGIRGHATRPDTDIGENYRFVLNGDEYRVIDIILTHGEVQATCVAVG